ncbi:MAG: hypothetical protein RR944_04600 [Acinetobacter sp.]|uniref:hypothetical protein n=1 Tax=Acinetobacter sp. TaxID=472 RepID=UPI002FC5E30D
MAKRFSPEFKQQAIDYALANSHESLAAIASTSGVGYSTAILEYFREAAVYYNKLKRNCKSSIALADLYIELPL